MEFDEEFKERIIHSLPKNTSIEDIHVFNSGLIAVINRQNKTSALLGCLTCLGRTPSQNNMGYPSFIGKQLLLAEDVKDIPENLSPEIKANLWVCPDCKLTIKKLLPKFAN